VSAPETRAPVRRRNWRRPVSLAAAVAFIGLGLGFLASPAAATEGNTGSVDTNTTSVYSQPSTFTEKGKGGDDDQCTGDKCKRINWCDGKGGNPHPSKITADAPMVLTGGKGGDKTEPECIKRPRIGYACCVVTKDGTSQDVPVTNRAEYPFKIKVQIGDSKPQIEWVKAGETVVFHFKNLENGEHKLVAAVWAGGKTWCQFKETTITVKCSVPTTPPTKPTTPPTSASPTPSTTTSSAAPGGGGNQPQLPVTGAPAGGVIAAGVGLLVLGAGAVFMYRRRQVRFTA